MTARPTLLAALAGCVLAGCAVAPTPPVLPHIEGRLEGPAAGSLAAPAEWVVELRDDSADRVLAEQRGTVTATQPPIGFVLRLDAARIDAAHRHSLRAAVQVRGRVQWLSAPHALELRDAPIGIDVGSLRLWPYTHPGGFASELDCGGRRFVVGFLGAQLRLTEGDHTLQLQPAPGSASAPGSAPARFERADDAATFVELDERGATVSLRGRLLPRCVAAPLR